MTDETHNFAWDMIVELRKEIIENQKIRAQIINYKIIFVGVAINFTLGKNDLTVFIPAFASIFFDFLINSYSIRIKRIGSYCRQYLEKKIRGTIQENDFLLWEEFLNKIEKKELELIVTNNSNKNLGITRTLAAWGNLGLTIVAIAFSLGFSLSYWFSYWTDVNNRQSFDGSIPFGLIYFFRWAVESGSYSLMRYTLSKMVCSRFDLLHTISLVIHILLWFFVIILFRHDLSRYQDSQKIGQYNYAPPPNKIPHELIAIKAYEISQKHPRENNSDHQLTDWLQAKNELKKSQNLAEAYNNRGNARYNLGDYQGAIEDYSSAIRINPNYAKAYNGWGIVREELGEYQAAIEDYNQAIRINPNYAKAYYNRGLARYKLGEFAAAIEDYNQAIRINPNDADAYLNRGNARYDLGEYREYPIFVNLLRKLTRILGVQGIIESVMCKNGMLPEYQAAIEDYTQAIRINPDYAIVYTSRGNARALLGEYQAAIEDFNQAIRIDPNDARGYNFRGLTRVELGESQAAIEDFNQAIRINPNYADAYNLRGLTHEQMGDKQRAISDFQKAADLFQQQGNEERYQKALDQVRRLQQ